MASGQGSHWLIESPTVHLLIARPPEICVNLVFKHIQADSVARCPNQADSVARCPNRFSTILSYFSNYAVFVCAFGD